LEAISVKEGETVNVGALIGAIGNGAAAAPKPAPAAAAAPSPAAPPHGEPAAANANSTPPSPSARKLMAENGIANGAVEGSGKHGQVLKEDVLASVGRAAAAPSPVIAPVAGPAPTASLTSAAATVAMPQTRSTESAATPAAAPAAAPARPAAAPQPAARQPAAAPAAPAPAPAPRGPILAEDAGREERVKMTRLRQTIARRLKDAQNTAAMLTTFNEVDMQPVMELRTRYKELFEKKHGVKLGFMGFFTLAVVHALKEIPNVNAEIDGDDLIYKNYAHIGVAVGTERGLVVPVVKNADQ